MPDLEQKLYAYVPENAIDFVVVFARFEFAMKRTGFVMRGRRGEANADWSAFSDAVPPDLFESLRGRAEVQVIFRTPAATLLCSEDGVITWSEPPAPSENYPQLLRQVKTIRNNLLHGDKNNIERDAELTRAALSVLNSTYDRLMLDPDFQVFVEQF